LFWMVTTFSSQWPEITTSALGRAPTSLGAQILGHSVPRIRRIPIRKETGATAVRDKESG
jgi:hypothetical protein